MFKYSAFTRFTCQSIDINVANIDINVAKCLIESKNHITNKNTTLFFLNIGSLFHPCNINFYLSLKQHIVLACTSDRWDIGPVYINSLVTVWISSERTDLNHLVLGGG